MHLKNKKPNANKKFNKSKKRSYLMKKIMDKKSNKKKRILDKRKN